MAASCRSTRPRRAPCPACSRCGARPTLPTVPPIDFREGSIPALDPYRQPVADQGPRALCRRSDCRGLRRRSLRRRGRRRSRRGGRSKNCRHCSTPGRAGGVFGRAFERGGGDPPGLWRRRRGISHRSSHRRARAWRSAGIPACRWKRAAPSAATTPRAALSNCMAPPKCRIAIRNCCRACSASRLARFTSTSRMSAAASVSAASSIPRMCWFASPPGNSTGR